MAKPQRGAVSEYVRSIAPTHAAPNFALEGQQLNHSRGEIAPWAESIGNALRGGGHAECVGTADFRMGPEDVVGHGADKRDCNGAAGIGRRRQRVGRSQELVLREGQVEDDVGAASRGGFGRVNLSRKLKITGRGGQQQKLQVTEGVVRAE